MDTISKFRADTRRPNPPPPPGSWDCQIHVFGDPAKYPLRAGTVLSPPPDATLEEAIKMHRALGIDHGVIVKSTAHGGDHRILFDALKRAAGKYVGVALINDVVDDREMQRLHDAGVRGARFNFWKFLNIVPTPREFLRAVDRMKVFGWHARINISQEELFEHRELLEGITIPVVIDHMAHLESADEPGLDLVLEFLRRDNWWIMVSSGDRFSKMDHGWDDMVPLGRKLTAASPDRAIWCSDWPHLHYTKPMPNDADVLDLMYRYTDDPLQWRKILVDNPRRLLGADFGASGSDEGWRPG